jgi:membrane-associated phospholipid phosphatase
MVGWQTPTPPLHPLLETSTVAVRTAPAPDMPTIEHPVELPVPPAEVRALHAVQRGLGRAPLVRTARGMSLFGEHAAGWLAVGVIGAVVDRRRRRDWLTAAAGVAAAHGASIAVKRVVRRSRPTHPRVQVLVGTPSRLSFPSAHATSTTAAAVLFGRLLGRRLVPVLVPPMALSRLVLGVHYPTDVAAGAALGAAVATATPRVARRVRERNWR